MLPNVTRIDDDLVDLPDLPEPYPRRRVLGMMGAALFGFAAHAFVPAHASAAPPPPGCSGAPGCGTCSGSVCTRCSAASYNCLNQSGRTCWQFKTPYGNGCYDIFKCCDWLDTNGVCICRAYVGRVCPTATTLDSQGQGRSGREGR